MIVIFAYLTYLIIINLRKTLENQTTTLMRILTNYLQVVSTVLAFDANYPDIVNDVFTPANIIGSSSESFVSLDCFIQDNRMNAFAPNETIFKITLVWLLPIALILIYDIVWICMYFILKKYFKDIKRNIIVSVVVILYLLHPALTRSSLSIFQ